MALSHDETLSWVLLLLLLL